jgi:hypothetical protein
MNTQIYGWLVGFYPADLRRDFGEEMVLVFAEELRDADAMGKARVWRRALGEFLRLAPSNWAAHPALRVPAISLAFAILSLATEGAMHYIAGEQARYVFASLLPTSAPVVIPLTVMWACRNRGMTALNLADKDR